MSSRRAQFSGWRWRKGVGFMRTNPGETQLLGEIMRKRQLMEGDVFPPGFNQRRRIKHTEHQQAVTNMNAYKHNLMVRLHDLKKKYSKYTSDWSAEEWAEEMLPGKNRKEVYETYKLAISDFKNHLSNQGFKFDPSATAKFRSTANLSSRLPLTKPDRRELRTHYTSKRKKYYTKPVFSYQTNKC